MESYSDGGYRLTIPLPGAPPRWHLVAWSDIETSRVTLQIDGGVHASRAESPPAFGSNAILYPLVQLLLMNHLAFCSGGVILHATGLDLDGRGLVFPGVSGAGKSTLARLLIAAGLQDSLLSDDRVVLRSCLEPHPQGCEDAEKERTRFVAWGTPWPGDARIARNSCVPLSALLFLAKASADRIMPLSPKAALRRLILVSSCPWYDKGRFPAVLDLCSRIAEQVPCYVLEFRQSRHVVDLLRLHPWEAPSQLVGACG